MKIKVYLMRVFAMIWYFSISQPLLFLSFECRQSLISPGSSYGMFMNASGSFFVSHSTISIVPPLLRKACLGSYSHKRSQLKSVLRDWEQFVLSPFSSPYSGVTAFDSCSLQVGFMRPLLTSHLRPGVTRVPEIKRFYYALQWDDNSHHIFFF